MLCIDIRYNEHTLLFKASLLVLIEVSNQYTIIRVRVA